MDGQQQKLQGQISVLDSSSVTGVQMASSRGCSGTITVMASRKISGRSTLFAMELFMVESTATQCDRRSYAWPAKEVAPANNSDVSGSVNCSNSTIALACFVVVLAAVAVVVVQ